MNIVIGKIRLQYRIVFLMIIWIAMLVLSLSFLAILQLTFQNDPQGETISSESWAGYIVSRDANANIQVNAINGSWTVPSVSTTAGDEHSSIWVGVGGQLDDTLIQAGTEQDASGGKEFYYSWYELIPAYAVRVNTIMVSPGDVMVASLRLVDPAVNRWNIQISDSTTGQYFGTTVSYNSTGSSGEWILERPTVSNNISTLADFGNVTFAGCHLSADSKTGPIQAFYFSRIAMTNSVNTQLASVSNIATNGADFTVKYVSTK